MGRYESVDPPPPPSEFVRKRQSKPTIKMDPKGKDIAEWLKELYWLTTNRAPRTQQVHLGPSELGDPCDNKLIRRLLQRTPSNHGGNNDGWAATVGTAIHAWLAEAIEAYDSGRGRFLVEHRINIPSELGDEWDVMGTLDLYDRKRRTVMDHKAMGESTLGKLRTTGEPDQRYKIQLQVYAHGLALQGEEPQDVAIIAWPRVESTLTKLFVWVASYDPAIARQALARRDSLLYARLQLEDGDDPTDLLRETPISPSSLCQYCPFYRPRAVDIRDGCRAGQ